ncbi:hypothetical protein KSP40_PGU000904 [Platanthera guangdongensis]|uniref:Uncharacterized protein n=1 Tax=Platanthera guangdongensis TaxID=2320717 RepID=A0ABR2M3W0_9ASPA
MIMYQHDPDVLKWGFGLLNGNPIPTSSYCGISNERDVNFYDGAYVREGNFGTDHTSLESDDTITHILQEEFSQLAAVEATGPANVSEEHLQASVHAQDWFAPTTRSLLQLKLRREGNKLRQKFVVVRVGALAAGCSKDGLALRAGTRVRRKARSNNQRADCITKSHSHWEYLRARREDYTGQISRIKVKEVTARGLGQLSDEDARQEVASSRVRLITDNVAEAFVDNRHRPLTQCSCTLSQVSGSDARAKRCPFNSNVIEVKAKRLPFSSNMETQSRAHICDAKTVKRSLPENSSDGGVAGEASGYTVYAKITCSQTVNSNSKTKNI